MVKAFIRSRQGPGSDLPLMIKAFVGQDKNPRLIFCVWLKHSQVKTKPKVPSPLMVKTFVAHSYPGSITPMSGYEKPILGVPTVMCHTVLQMMKSPYYFRYHFNQTLGKGLQYKLTFCCTFIFHPNIVWCFQFTWLSPSAVDSITWEDRATQEAQSITVTKQNRHYQSSTESVQGIIMFFQTLSLCVCRLGCSCGNIYPYWWLTSNNTLFEINK